MSTIVEIGVAVPAAAICPYVALVIFVSINSYWERRLGRGDRLARIGGGVWLTARIVVDRVKRMGRRVVNFIVDGDGCFDELRWW